MEMASFQLKEKSKNQRVGNLSKLIKMAGEEIIAFQDMSNMKAEPVIKLHKYYKAFEMLNS